VSRNLTLPDACPSAGFEYATSFLECCWSCQSRLIAYKNVKAEVKMGKRDIGLCEACEKGMLP
jgi:hypothetical protein